MRTDEQGLPEVVPRSPGRTFPGEMFFLHRRVSPVAWAIMYGDHRTLTSHVGMIVEDGDVVEALTSGVTKRPFAEYADDKSYLRVSI